VELGCIRDVGGDEDFDGSLVNSARNDLTSVLKASQPLRGERLDFVVDDTAQEHSALVR
jgi:hypothetical protein